MTVFFRTMPSRKKHQAPALPGKDLSQAGILEAATGPSRKMPQFGRSACSTSMGQAWSFVDVSSLQAEVQILDGA